MNRTAFYSLLFFLLLVAPASAEQLYRWVEKDGAITFSPTPPPKGVEFELTSSDSHNSKNDNLSRLNNLLGNTWDGAESLNTEQDKSSTADADAEDTQPFKIRATETKVMSRPIKPSSLPEIQYAPESISASAEKRITVVSPSNSQPKVTQNIKKVASNTVLSEKKRQQCLDLSKRVVSLEHRLRSTLSADEMDNTVVAMARYQKSYNQFCIR